MADAANAGNLPSPSPVESFDDVCIWDDTFAITNFKSDPVRWNKDWEQALHELPSKDVYSKMCLLWKRSGWDPAVRLSLAQGLQDGLRKLQENVLGMWNEMENFRRLEKFRVVWLLLEDDDRQRHLLNGLAGASQSSSWGQSARALCPEITITSMMEVKGRTFIEFASDYHKSIKDICPSFSYFLPSMWWEKALQDAPKPLSDEDKLAFELLTIQREEFVCLFIKAITLSIVEDIVHGNAGMDKAKDIMKRDPVFARSWDRTVSGLRVKPNLRYENCTKSPEEIGGNVVFMVCSACKNKLDFAVHYCSQECQKQDWRKHKKHCGKQKISKKLRGTVHDPYWAFPDVSPDLPDHIRDSLPKGDSPASWDSIGFAAPHPSRSVSPALQRQITHYTNDKNVDYFLFDELDRPIPFVLPVSDMWTKITFRNLRVDAIASVDQAGLNALAEYLIKVMGKKPGLSRDLILAQLDREYGEGIAGKLEAFQKRTVTNGYKADTTFVEITAKTLAQSVLRVMSVNPQAL